MDEINLKRAALESKEIDFNVFLQDGVIVTLEIKRWRGKNKLDESELGLQQNDNSDYNDFMNKYVTLGSKNLFPKDILEKISSIEVRARKNLKEYSYESPWGRFVPLTAYDKWKDNNEKLQEEFFTIRDEIVRDYDVIIGQVKSDYMPLAGTVYKRINGVSIGAMVQVPKEFVQGFLQEILDQIPSPEEIKDSFIYESNLSSLPDLVTGMEGISDISDLSTQIPDTSRIIDMLPSETMTGNIIDDSSKQEKKKKIKEDINKSLLGSNNEKLETFINNVLNQIREISIEASNDILSSIEKNEGKMVGRTSIRARNLIEKVRAMDFYGDSTIREYIDKIETLLNEEPKKRSVNEIKTQVEKLKEYSENSLKEINKNISVKRSYKKGKKQSVSADTNIEIMAEKKRGGKIKPQDPSSDKNIEIHLEKQVEKRRLKK